MLSLSASVLSHNYRLQDRQSMSFRAGSAALCVVGFLLFVVCPITIDRATISSFNPIKNETSPYFSIRNETSPPKEPFQKHFLYLIQTESCLPAELRTNDTLGDANWRSSDVLVLSFKEPCNDLTHSPRVDYIFDNSTTWTTGRNLLFTTAMYRTTTYLYYIFMDDDAIVKDVRTEAPALRAFEGFLQSHRPAVMGLLQTNDAYGEQTEEYQDKKGCSREKVDYLSGVHFDAIVNAFHFKAIKHLLPYVTDFDTGSWWASQMGLIVRTEILFRGQFLYHRYIKVVNPQHRPYPRSLEFDQMFPRFTEGLDLYAAERCVPGCARILIDRWIQAGNARSFDSETLCLPSVPPNDPIEPCRYQCSLLGIGAP
jgi:hypothetical protein